MHIIAKRGLSGHRLSRVGLSDVGLTYRILPNPASPLEKPKTKQAEQAILYGNNYVSNLVVEDLPVPNANPPAAIPTGCVAPVRNLLVLVRHWQGIILSFAIVSAASRFSFVFSQDFLKSNSHLRSPNEVSQLLDGRLGPYTITINQDSTRVRFFFRARVRDMA